MLSDDELVLIATDTVCSSLLQSDKSVLVHLLKTIYKVYLIYNAVEGMSTGSETEPGTEKEPALIFRAFS